MTTRLLPEFRSALLPFVAGGCLLAAVSCAGDAPTDPGIPPGPAPEITISGVEDGGEYEDPVTVEISVSPDDASYAAELNGEPFASGTEVHQPNQYELVVEAEHAGATAVEQVSFTLVFTGDRVLIIRMIDLGPHVPFGGGGDALLLTDSTENAMTHAMVDAGPAGFDEDEIDFDHVADRLAEMGVDTLQFLQLTHAHADHYGGMQEVLEDVHVRRFVYNGQVRTQTGYDNTLDAADFRAEEVMVVEEEWEYTLGSGSGATHTVHIPGLPEYLDEDTDDGRKLNEGSLGTYVEQGGVRIFLTGDGEDQANDRWRTEFPEYTWDIDVLKVGHHGANNAVFDDRVGDSPESSWLDHTRPELNLITANGRTHPRQRALDRILGLPAAVTYCTNVHGTVELRVNDAGEWRVTTERNADEECEPGFEATT